MQGVHFPGIVLLPIAVGQEGVSWSTDRNGLLLFLASIAAQPRFRPVSGPVWLRDGVGIRVRVI